MSKQQGLKIFKKILFFLTLVLLTVAVKCGSLIEGEESDGTTAAGGSGAGSGSGSASCSGASSVTVSQLTNNSTQAADEGNGTRVAQSFVVSSNTKLTKIEVVLAPVAADTTVTVKVYLSDGTDNPEAGTLLGTASATTSGGAYVYYAFSYDQISLSTGQTYYFVLQSTSSSGTNAQNWAGGGSAYGGGQAYVSAVGVWGVQTTTDLTFKISTCN